MTTHKHNQPSLDKVDLLFDKTEAGSAALDQKELIDLKEDELASLKAKIEGSKMESLKKQETLVIIGKQQELLRLKTQMNNRLSNQKNPQTPPSEKPQIPMQEKTIAENVKDFSIGVTDSILPKTLTKDWSETTKQRVGLGMTLGATVLTAWILYSWMKGKDAAANTKGGFLKKALVAVGVGGLAFAGYQYWKGAFTVEGVLEKAKNELEEKKGQALALKQKVFEPWAEYGLEEKEYEKAEDIYVSKHEDGVEDIKTVFNLEGNDTNPRFEAFMKKMREKHPEYVKDGITYVRANDALESYKATLGTAIGILKDMSEDHWVEILGTAAALKYFNIVTLRGILMSTKGVFELAADLGRYLLSWGGTIARNPIVSLLLIGGACGSLNAAEKTVFLPKNLGELAKAAKGNNRMIDGKSADMSPEKMENLEKALRKNAAKLEGIEKNTDGWVKTHMGALLASLKEKAKHGFALTMGETIENRTTRGIQKLATSLERKRLTTVHSGEANEKQKVTKYQAALDQLDVFEKAYIAHRCGENTESNLPQTEYETLTKLLTDPDVGVKIGIENDIVWWTDENREEKWGICVDPSIKNQNKIHKVSWDIRQSESDVTHRSQQVMDIVREKSPVVVEVGYGALGELGAVGTELADMGIEATQYYLAFQKEVSEGDIGPAILKFFEGGFGIAYELGSFTIFRAGRTFSLPLTTGMKVLRWMETEKNENIGVLWGASGVAYFVGKTTYNLIMRGQYTGIRALTAKEIGWATLKMAPGPFAPVIDNLGNVGRAFTREGWDVLKMRYITETTAGKGYRWIVEKIEKGRGRGINTVKGLERAVERWREMQENIKHMKAIHKQKLIHTYTDADIKRYKELIETQSEYIEKGIRSFTPDAHTPPMIRELWEQRNRGNLGNFEEQIDEIQSRYHRVHNANKATTGANTPSAPKTRWWETLWADETTHGTLIEVPDTTPRFVKELEDAAEARQSVQAAAGAAVVDTVTDIPKTNVDKILETPRIAKLLQGKNAADVQKIRDALSALAPEEVESVLKSRKAISLLKGSVQAAATTGNVLEIQRVVTAAKSAQALRIKLGAGWNGVGVVGDLFGCYMAYCDWQANNKRVEETENPALKDLYASANWLYAVEGGASAAGIVVGGVAVYTSFAAGSSVLVALGAPAGFIMLPVAFLVMGARKIHQGLEKSAEYHLLDERDLTKNYSSGQLLERIAATGPVKPLNFEQSWLVNAEAAKQGNEGARNEGYRAYFAQIAAGTLSPVDVLDIDVDAKATVQEKQAAIDSLQRERVALFVRDAVAYIDYKTDGTYTLVTPDILHAAALYGEMQFDKREAGETVGLPSRTDISYWKGVDVTLSNRALESYSKIVTDITEAGKQSANILSEELEQKLLYLLRDDLATCELKILATNFSNWKAMTELHWTGEEQMRSVARGVFAAQIWDILRECVQNAEAGKTVGTKEVEQVLAQMKKVLAQDPDSIARQTLNGSGSSFQYFEKIGTNPNRLTAPGMKDFLGENTLTAPSVLKTDANSAYSLDNLKYYYGQNIENKMPIVLEIPAGTEKGFLKVDEPMWLSVDTKKTYTEIGTFEYLKTLKMEPEHVYHLWYPNHMKTVGQKKLDDTYDMTTDQSPDIEIIVKQSDNFASADSGGGDF